MASRVEEIRARLAASRQQSTASTHVTPRSSLGSVATQSTAGEVAKERRERAATGAVEAADTTAELRQALKEKEKAIALLTRDNAKVTQLLNKATTKSDEVQGKWEAEKAAFAAHKKEAMALKLETQKELRQAQAATRAAQAAQEKLQREVERLKEKLAAATSHATSTATTPMATPRGAPLAASGAVVPDARDATEAALRLRLTRVETENDTLKERVAQLGREGAAAVKAAVAEAEARYAARQKTSHDEMEELRRSICSLTDTLALRDGTLRAKETEIEKLTSEAAQTRQDLEEQQQRLHGPPERLDAGINTDSPSTAVAASPVAAGSASTPVFRESQDELPHASPQRSPRQVVTFALSAKEATAHLQEELTATQCQVSAYKRMQEHADRRIEQLEAELASMQHRARDAVEALQRRIQDDKDARATTATSDAPALDAVRRELAKVREECTALKQEVQESGEEAVTLRCALEEAEDERDVYERQLRDLQQQHSKSEWAARSALETATTGMAAKLTETQEELSVTRDTARQRELQLEEVRAQRDGLETRVGEMERQMAEAAEAQRASLEGLKKQVVHYKRKSKSLTKKLAEAEKELQVLGEDHARVCDERDAAILRCYAEEETGIEEGTCRQALAIQTQRQPSDQVDGDLSLQSDGVPNDSVSRDLSGALLSANRAASTRRRINEPLTAALAQEQQAREHLEREVSALQSKVAAMEHLASPIMNSLVSDSVASLPSVHSDDLAPPRLRGISEAPPRARSPQTTHALDLRFFDPTAAEASTTATVSLDSVAGRGSRDGLLATCVSPHRSQLLAVVSPGRVGHAVLPAAHSERVSSPGGALDAVYADEPLPPVFSADRADGTGTAVSSRRAVVLLFSATAGCLLVSKRGRQLHRPLVATRSLPRSSGGADGGGTSAGAGEREGEEREEVACCAALASMSHAIYASRMAAEGRFDLQHTYRFTVRVQTDCTAGEILVGFADRYVPLESFGVKRNALRYKGCYYVNLQTGRLSAPSQGVFEESYLGWEAAAGAAAARRWQQQEQQQRHRGARPSRRWQDPLEDGASTSHVSPSSSPSRHGAAAVPPACVVRAGDEVSCVLRLDERSIGFAWNGVDCGVAFTGVSLSPSLYPCVEVNHCGATVELL